MQSAAVALQKKPSKASSESWTRAVLWFAMISYAFVPWLLSESWKRSLALSTLAFAWAVSGPAMAWLSFQHAARTRVSRPAVVIEAVAATVTPPFFAIFGVALAFAGWLPYRTYIWWGVVAGVVVASRLAAPSIARPNLRLRRLHSATALPLMLFLVAHVANHVMAIGSLEAHVQTQNMLRLVYRSAVVEPLLIVAAISQIVTGVLLVWNARGFQFTPVRGLQFLSGAYLSMFFFSHLNAVLLFGRRLQAVDTTFEWATGGRAGLLASAGSAQLLPYYFLSVVAFFLHTACAGRRVLVTVIGDRGAERVAWAVGVGGCLVALALLAPLTGFRLR
jgi:hypothetical protein